MNERFAQIIVLTKTNLKYKQYYTLSRIVQMQIVVSKIIKWYFTISSEDRTYFKYFWLKTLFTTLIKSDFPWLLLVKPEKNIFFNFIVFIFISNAHNVVCYNVIISLQFRKLLMPMCKIIILNSFSGFFKVSFHSFSSV